MDEQEILHKISVNTDINIELLKEVVQNQKFMALIKSGKTMDAIMLLRTSYVTVDLSKAKVIVDSFSAEFK